MRLSKYFTLEELTFSQTALRRGLNNTPSKAMILKLTWLAAQMDTVRALLGHPIHISSGYRSASVNRAIGGSSTSQHCKGEAVDFVCPAFGTPRDICVAVMKSNIPYDQLIYEGTWVHISFSKTNNRRQVLTAKFSSGTVQYTSGIV